MRIVAGKYRGRRLASFAGEEIRPTPDRVKESLFQILSPRLAGARVLDLFSGSGALGLECLSRGAEDAVFNDGGAGYALTKKNLALLGVRAEVRKADYAVCLASLKGRAFDLIFCDPPYAENCCKDVLSRISAAGVLKEGGLVVYESEREESAAEGWRLADRRGYGRVKVFFFERENG